MELTVCVCVRDGAGHVDRCMGALLSETAPFGDPIVVVDHASRDETPQRLARWAGEYPDRLRVLRFEGEGLAAARDFAWRQSQTPWLVFVDIDCQVQPGWAAAAHAALAFHAPDDRCGAFGGTNRVAQDGRLLHEAISVLLATYIGGHNSILNRAVPERRRVDHCPTLNVAYRRRALEESAGFDLAYTRVSEDVEVSRRLRAQGYSLWATPGMIVDHVARPTLRGWLGNVFLYGRGRSFHLKRQPDDFHLKFLAPAAMALAYPAAALIGAVSGAPLTALALLAALHLGCIGVLLAGETRRQGGGMRVWSAACATLWLTHLAYGAGFLYELPRRSDKFVS
jgi:glycosyltransferase involved in cell wall biosynthesis